MDETFLTSKLSRAKKLLFQMSFSGQKFQLCLLSHGSKNRHSRFGPVYKSKFASAKKIESARKHMFPSTTHIPDSLLPSVFFFRVVCSDSEMLLENLCMFVCQFFYMKHKFLIRNNLNSWLSKILKTKKIIPLVNGIYGIVKIN